MKPIRLINRYLSNGMRVLLIPRQASEMVHLEVFYDVGSGHETFELNGAAHFLEHMAFKATERRPSPVMIARELDGVGAEFNAATGQKQTTYYVRVASEELPFAVDILSDMLLHSTFPQAELDIERGAICEEVKRNLDLPSRRAYNLMQAGAFPNMALGRPVVGTVQSVTDMSRDQLLGFRARHYLPERSLVVIVGNFDEAEAYRLLDDTFGAWRPDIQEVVTLEPLATLEPRPMVLMHHQPDAKQANVYVGLRTFGRNHPGQNPLELLTNVIGGTMSSRLFVKVREEKGWAYSIGAGTFSHRDHGQFLVAGGLTAKHLVEAVEIIVGELVDIKAHGITEEELTLAKRNIRGQTALAVSRPSFLCDFHAEEAMCSSTPRTVAEYLAALEAVTLDEIREVAHEVFRASTFRMGLVGPDDASADIESLVAAKLGD